MLYKNNIEKQITPKLIIIFSLFISIILLACSSAPNIKLDSKRSLQVLNSGHFPAKFDILYHHTDEWDAILVSDILKDAFPKAEEWGVLKSSIQIKILPSHMQLEKAVKRKGYGWLRAWAMYDKIYIQAPSTWGGSEAHLYKRVQELMLHELTHVVMYQTVGTAKTWYKKKIPLWFREGMASYVAKQGQRRLSRSQIAKYINETQFEGNILTDAPSLVKHQQKIVYSAAHWAFEDLVKLHGKDSVITSLKLIGQGHTFDAAWNLAMGQKSDVFVLKWNKQFINKEQN